MPLVPDWRLQYSARPMSASTAETLAGPRRSDQFSQPAVLEEALSLLGPGRVAVFDLDSTLLDNRPRQVRIVRELGRTLGDERLVACQAAYWTGWDLETPLARCGLSPAEVSALADQAKTFWRERFFTSEYCQDDVPIAGAAGFLARVARTGAVICYVTGRHVEMGFGTIQSFERGGFLIPNEGRVRLLLKPAFPMSDDAWKREVAQRLPTFGRVACAFDNEPTHINGYRADFPESLAVHLDTDHSGRPVPLLEGIPSIRDFVL